MVDKDDRVSITLAGGETHHFEEYSVRQSVLAQPSTFSLRLSAANGTAKLIKQLPRGTSFTLNIAGQPQFTGETDGIEASGRAGETSVTVFGRSPIGRLVDTDIPAERSFTNVTYEQLVTAAMEDVGLGDRLLFTTNEATRKIRSGHNVKTIREPKVPEGVIGLNRGATHIVHARLGERWFTFLQRHLTKGGIFLFDDARGDLVIAAPNRYQVPSYVFVRQRGQARNVVNVESAHFRDDATRRFAECVVYARAPGGRSGRIKATGRYIDLDMVEAGFVKRRVFRDVNVTTPDEAAYYARRMVAEHNRSGWRLRYTLSGHVAPTNARGGRAVVVPDTMATVNDDELGIHEDLYLETVEYTSPPRQTHVTFMRPADMVFGDKDDDEDAQAKARAKYKTARRKMLSFVRDRKLLSFERDPRRES